MVWRLRCCRRAGNPPRIVYSDKELRMNQDATPNQQRAISDLVRGLLDNRMSRRAFVTRATILGLSATSICATLAPCGPGGATRRPSSGTYDPKKYAGTQ